MSELIDAYKARMPEKCLTCPVFASAVVAAESYEKNSISVTSAMVEAIDGGPFQIPEVDAIWQSIHSMLLEMATDDELRGTKVISRLAENGPECPTPKRGGAPYEVVSSKIISWLMNKRVCQNPGLKQILEQ